MEDPVKISVFLPPDIHRKAKLDAIKHDTSLTKYVAELVIKAVKPKARKKAA